MSFLLEARDTVRSFYSKYEIYILPVVKFILAFFVLLMVNLNLGYMTKINNTTVVLVAALLCSFLPVNLLVVIAAVFVVLHLYAISLECAVVALAVFLLMFLLYYRFAPKDALVVLFLPVAFSLKIPILIPILVGLLCGPASVVSVTCGVIVYYVINYMKVNATIISAMDLENVISKFRYVMDGLMASKEMILFIISFCITTIIVYIIRRLSVDHAWTIAMFVGAVCNIVILLMGNLKYNADLSIGGLIIGSIVSVLLAKVVQFFAFNVDYTRTEYVQFEDDEYYYYVKAIPKNTVTKAKRTLKKITSVI